NHGAAVCDICSHRSNCEASGAASADQSLVLPLPMPKVFISSKNRSAAAAYASSGLKDVLFSAPCMCCALPEERDRDQRLVPSSTGDSEQELTSLPSTVKHVIVRCIQKG